MPIPSRIISFRAAALLAVVSPAAAQTYLGPVPYLSQADQPSGFLAGGHVLEDFEDLSLDFGLTKNTGVAIGPGGNTDSVDGDDGVIDGLGRDGRSFFGFGPVTFRFPGAVREAGIVWTDGSPGADVTFEAFGPGMVSLGVHGPFVHNNGSTNGGTDEDRFYGIQDPNGIVAIRMTVGGNTSFEVDHVQFDTLGMSYCVANPNSRGLTGVQTVVGSHVASDNEVTLVASRLPSNTFGFFITSRTQGFVANPAGSEGNLCLSGSIGRFNASIFNPSNLGHGILAIDLNSIPSPIGLTAIQAGETWNFQAWHRDTAGGQATSNFTDAVSVAFV